MIFCQEDNLWHQYADLVSLYLLMMYQDPYATRPSITKVQWHQNPMLIKLRETWKAKRCPKLSYCQMGLIVITQLVATESIML